MSRGQQRRLAFFLLGALLAYMLYQSNAQGRGLLGGVGSLMSPSAGGGGSPSSPFTITTEAGSALTTEASSNLVTQAAP